MKMSKRYAVLKQNMNGKKVSEKKLNNQSNIITINTGTNKTSKKMIVSLSLVLVMIFVVTVASSYAFFTSTVKGKEFVIYTGSLAVNYSKKTDVINVENLYPMTNAEGLNQTPHEFTITNDGNINARYQVRLELDNSIKNMISTEYIKLSYSIDGSSYSEPVLLSNLDTSLAFVRNIQLEPTKSNTIGIKLWIDLNAPNEVQGKVFKAKVVVDSIQDVEDGYVVDTTPIIYLNKDTNGNQDINLKVGETYNELGVEKIEDDQDILTPSQVTKTYEYYDGENLSTVESIDTSKTGIYYITYSITDKSNNVGKSTRIVTVNNTDTIPSITLNGDSTITLGEKDYYKEEGVTVKDNNQVVIIGEVKTSTIGTYIVRYIVIDSNNNLNSVVRTVNITKAYEEEILNGADPVLTSNLIPVQIADDGTVTRISTLSTWYDYETKQWANAVVLRDTSINYANNETIPEDNIESYFVWIPKYSYQLWDLGNYDSLTSIDSTKPHAIPIKFGLTNTSDSNTGECTTPGVAGESGNCKVGDYMTHPAFLAFDSNGMWIGKFETGYDGATTTEEAQINNSDSSKIIIKPNVYSWTNITVGNMFKASYDYLRDNESHIIKNTEWGAVAYLSHSLYGMCDDSKCSEIRINNNGSYITGYASTTETTEGYNSGTSIEGNRVESTALSTDGTYTVNYLNSLSNIASTTGNKSGVYDISGGAWEYVMGYTIGSTITGGSSEIAALYSDFFTNSNWEKYYDKYSSISYINYTNRILGDATGEMGPFETFADLDGITRLRSSWYGDHSFFISDTHSWFIRSGAWPVGTGSGIFAFNHYPGFATPDTSYRIVLTP